MGGVHAPLPFSNGLLPLQKCEIMGKEGEKGKGRENEEKKTKEYALKQIDFTLCHPW